MTILAEPMGSLLFLIYNFIGNYGISIILFTIIVKIILLPLTIKQTKSMKNMQEIQPKVKQLQEKYKNDKEKLNVKMMELYKEHNVNPMGGCLPLLVQFPIIIGLFTALRQPWEYVFSIDYLQTYTDVQLSALEAGEGLIQALETAYISMDTSFLWLPNLSEPDTWILPILAAALTYLSSATMSANKEVQQTQKMMTYFFPVLIFVMGSDVITAGFPAGLTLYWVVNSGAQIIQQLIINKPEFLRKGDRS